MALILKTEKGVTQASFEKNKAELHVKYNPKLITVDRMLQRVSQLGFVALKGPGKGAYLPPVKFLPSMDVKWVSRKGEAVNMKQHLVAGKVTVFDFSAKWCGPCKDVDRALFTWLKSHNNVALRKINVVDWDTPVAKQFLSTIGQLPYLVIYGKKGKTRVEVVGNKLDEIRATLKRLGEAQ